MRPVRATKIKSAFGFDYDVHLYKDGDLVLYPDVAEKEVIEIGSREVGRLLRFLSAADEASVVAPRAMSTVTRRCRVRLEKDGWAVDFVANGRTIATYYYITRSKARGASYGDEIGANGRIA